MRKNLYPKSLPGIFVCFFGLSAGPALRPALAQEIPAAPVQETLTLTLDNWSGKIPGQKKADGFEIVATTPEPGKGAGMRWDLWKVSALTFLPPTAPADWSGYTHLNFSVYNAAATDIPLRISAASGEKGYFLAFVPLDTVGWKQVSVPFKAFGKAHDPLGWDKVDKLTVGDRGWNKPEPKESKEIYLTDFFLSRPSPPKP